MDACLLPWMHAPAMDACLLHDSDLPATGCRECKIRPWPACSCVHACMCFRVLAAFGRGMVTLGYTAPEAIDGPSTPATDVWSFGIMLYEMVTGKVCET